MGTSLRPTHTKTTSLQRIEEHMPRTLNVNVVISVCLLTVGAAPAVAAWTQIVETDFVTTYMDLGTIRKQGNIRKVWKLWDFKERQKRGELSVVLDSEHDCKEKKGRPLEMILYSQNMAKGNVIISSTLDDPEWNEIAPATEGGFTLKTVCNVP